MRGTRQFIFVIAQCLRHGGAALFSKQTDTEIQALQAKARAQFGELSSNPLSRGGRVWYLHAAPREITERP
jgi:hypothetical protein